MTVAATEARRLPLHQRIVWARNSKAVSQERFAEQIGTSRRHMIRIEKGVHRPGPVLLARIAEATEQPLEFFTDEDDEESEPVGLDVLAALRPLARLLAQAAKTTA